MRKGSFVYLAGVMLVAFFVVSPTLVLGEDVTVDPWFVEKMTNNEVILEPGTTVYCNKNFSVENLGKDTAEVFILRGSDNYDIDMIPAKGKLSYKLRDRSIFAGQASRGIWVSEARIVNSTLGEAKLKIRCK